MRRQEGRLAHLRYLVFHWPPQGAASLAALRALCPRLVCNGRSVPEAADPSIELDEAALDAIAHLGDPAGPAGRPPRGPDGVPGAAGSSDRATAPAPAAAALAPGPGAAAAPPSLAERFKAAYASRAAKLSLEHARNVRRAERRRLAALGGAERAVRMAELGVPLMRLRR